MGINIPTREELIANKLDAQHLAEAVRKLNEFKCVVCFWR